MIIIRRKKRESKNEFQIEITRNPQYKVGETHYIKGEGYVILKERSHTYPTDGENALVRWKVAFLDRWGNEIEGDFYRPIEEVGVPNKHFHEKMDWGHLLPEKKKSTLNRTKARAIIRKFKRGEINMNSSQLGEAVEFLLSIDDDKYVEKHYYNFLKSK